MALVSSVETLVPAVPFTLPLPFLPRCACCQEPIDVNRWCSLYTIECVGVSRLVCRSCSQSEKLRHFPMKHIVDRDGSFRFLPPIEYRVSDDILTKLAFKSQIVDSDALVDLGPSSSSSSSTTCAKCCDLFGGECICTERYLSLRDNPF